MRKAMRWVVTVGLLASASCVWIFQKGGVEEEQVPPPNAHYTKSALRVFLKDGSIVLFPVGATLTPDSIAGIGTRYALGLQDAAPASVVPMEEVLGIESLWGSVDEATSVGVSLLASAAGVMATAAAAVAIFGSCPTFYAQTSDGPTLQAEAFSYSIAPLMEARDVDGLEVRPDPDGMVRLELRNEALETHYLNRVALLEVSHAPGRHVASDELGRPVGFGTLTPPAAAHDRDGRDVLADVLHRDGRAFKSSEARLATAGSADPQDQVDLTFPSPAAGTVALVLRLRDSLLNTVLLYDLMLQSPGGGSVDWLGKDLQQPGTALAVSMWFRQVMGLHVLVEGSGGWHAVARIPDTGPIAWKEVAVRIPVPRTDSLRIRLDFLTDEWRIDQVSLAEDVSSPPVTELSIRTVRDRDGGEDEDARARLSAVDDEYMVTGPGTVETLEFAPTPRSEGEERSYFLSTQGYYAEWLRPSWLHLDKGREVFRPTPRTVDRLMALWRQEKDSLETRFYASRIPVR